MIFKDAILPPLWEKIRGGQRLTHEDGLSLFASPDLLGVGWMADQIRRQRHGDRATFVFNRQINPTNICLLSCKFCDYASKEGWDNAYVLSDKEILDRLSPELREVHIVGGLYRKWSFDDYLNVLRVVRRAYPHIQIKAYTAVEIDYFSRIEKISLRQVLERLQAEGLVALPGGGAEVFSKRVRKIIADRKVPAETWLAVHREAHSLGMRTNATLLFGHFETPEEQVDHMRQLRELQDDTQGFQAFIPLPFLPGNTEFAYLPGPSREEKLRTIAVGRLFLDNFSHIKGHWVMLGEEITSEALSYGLNDLSGTLTEERIAHATTVETPLGLTQDRIRQLVVNGGKTPGERNTLYGTIDREQLTPA